MLGAGCVHALFRLAIFRASMDPEHRLQGNRQGYISIEFGEDFVSMNLINPLARSLLCLGAPPEGVVAMPHVARGKPSAECLMKYHVTWQEHFPIFQGYT